MCTLPTQYAPIIIILSREHIVYLTYTNCSEYHCTTEVAYCVPNLHNMLPLSRYYQVSILCTLPTQYAHITKMLPRLDNVYIPTQYAPIIIFLPHYHTTKVAYCVPYLHNMLQSYNSTEVAYCVPYLHNMLQIS